MKHSERKGDDLPETVTFSAGPRAANRALSHPSEATFDIPGELVNHPRYRIISLLGTGGMGAVYRAEHLVMERHVALKVIRPEYTKYPESIERFRREVRAAARLVHPNIVVAHDAEQAGDLHFLVMELVDGVNLAELVKRRGRFSVQEACEAIRQAALGLHHAYCQGMVHRDIKPQNMIQTAKGTTKILDFGLARFVLLHEADVLGHDRRNSTQDGAELTFAGGLMGTPDFMAPEQILGSSDVDTRADIYSLGCSLYYLLAGQSPFRGMPIDDKLDAHVFDRPTRLSELGCDVPARLRSFVDSMLAKHPDRRPQTPGHVADFLAEFGNASSAGIFEAIVTVPERPVVNLEPSLYAPTNFFLRYEAISIAILAFLILPFVPPLSIALTIFGLIRAVQTAHHNDWRTPIFGATLNLVVAFFACCLSFLLLGWMNRG